MATSIANDSRCATCGKAAGTFTCRGCAKDFCLRHTTEHRQELSKQMDEDLIPLHDQLQENLNEQTKSPHRHHPLFKEIDEWEQASVEKVRQTANDARKQLSDAVNEHTIKLKKTLDYLTQQLKKARDDDHFFETDLKEWMIKLDALKEDMSIRQTINIKYDNNPISFIEKILIDQREDGMNERFEQVLGDIQISNNGTVVTHNQTNSYASIRGKCEYSSGKHRLRFLIKNLTGDKWMFLGVVTKSTHPVVTYSIGKSTYGFSGEDNVWRDGSLTTALNNYRSDFQINDTIELFINCDEQKLQLTNERTRNAYTLHVDTNKCPFPWKLTVGFHSSPGERIRILL